MNELQEQARLLKQQGYTNPQIVTALPGIKLDWLKRNLPNVAKVSNEAADEATCMKVAGSSYKEIVQALSGAGITEHWCKVNLKDVQENKAEADLIQSIIQEATKPEGVTNFTLKGLVLNSSKADKATDFKYISSLKSKAKRLDEKCLFRPSWLAPNQALASRDSMYDKANIAFERLQELAWEHAIQFGVTQQSALMEIVNLSNAWLYEESIERRLERHNTVAEVLTRQVVQIESAEIIPHGSLCVSWLEQDGGADRVYDTHCI
ncbi:hypothetical protein GIW67_02220 [Pseudomonas lactis]|uniref:hypothetical protein n=1 Tax=Pseudomonas lactis TaxID=1615674 RepID=UPI001F33ECC7|nr:hypothetical protein [Pseudomonas lactis]MCF5016773.1 hypothetical protein [Pseudomonas lactis]